MVFSFQWTKSLEAELEPKTLDVWSQSRSFEISVPTPQPCFRLCRLWYKNCIC